MTTCPSCGHKILDLDAKTELVVFIKNNQKRMGMFINLKREISSKFKVKKFADLPTQKYPEALEYIRNLVDYYTSCWDANKMMEIAIPKYFETIPSQPKELQSKLEQKLRKQFGDKYWAEMEPEQAVEVIKNAVGDTNLWEFAYGPSNGQ